MFDCLFSGAVDKRQEVDVSRLAEILNNMKKQRDVDADDGVKLNGMRFG